MVSTPELDSEQLQNLLPKFSKQARASRFAVNRVPATPILLRPDLHERRRRTHSWLTDNFPIAFRAVLEAVAAAGALIALPVVGMSIPVVLLTVLLLGVVQKWKHELTLSVLDDLPRLAVSVAAAVSIVELIVNHAVTLPRLAVLWGVVLAAVVVARTIAYWATGKLRQMEKFQRRTILIGSGKVASELVRAMQASPDLGLKPHALLDDSPMPAAVASTIPVEPLANQLRSYIAIHQIDTVVIAFSAMRESALLSLLRECDRMDCEILVVPRLFEFVSVSGDMDRIHAIPLVRIRRDAHRSLAWRIKRVASRVLAATTMIVLSPLLAALALAVWLDDRSAPILFKQIRVTGDDGEFECLKFRSMKPESTQESDTTWNISQDHRVGRLGKFMRRSSLDELPQLWNVVRGDMDLVGPRPERPHFVDKFASEIPGYSARHRVPGGLTGWAAVHGFRGDTSLKDRALYDNFYIENWSLWLDVKIILRTVVSIIRRTGG